LRAVAASKHDAAMLHLDVGTPLLEIERVALTLDKKPVELRVSRCSTRNHHYQNVIF
jgi:GntR family transcriptional regulator